MSNENLRDKIPSSNKLLLQDIDRMYVSAFSEACESTRDIRKGIKLQDLQTLAYEMLMFTDPVSAYGILAKQIPGKYFTYYDALVGTELIDMYMAIDLAIQSQEDRDKCSTNIGIDIGCGTGFGAKILSQRAHTVYAIDKSTNMVNAAKKDLDTLCQSRRHLTFNVFTNDILNNNLPTNYFDIVLNIGLTNFFTREEKYKFYSEVARILKSGGRCYEPQTDVKDQSIRNEFDKFAVAVGAIPIGIQMLNLKDQKSTAPKVNLEELGFVKIPVISEIPNIAILKAVKV